MGTPLSVKHSFTHYTSSIHNVSLHIVIYTYFDKKMTYGTTIDINVQISTEADVSTSITIKVWPDFIS